MQGESFFFFFLISEPLLWRKTTTLNYNHVAVYSVFNWSKDKHAWKRGGLYIRFVFFFVENLLSLLVDQTC